MSFPPPTDQASHDADSQALDWFVRRGRGLDAKEEAEFQAWLAADAGNIAALQRWEADWQDLGALPADAIAALKQGLEQEKAAESARAKSGIRARVRTASIRWAQAYRYRPATSWVATALVALFIAGMSWWGWQRPDYEHSFVTARGEQLNVELPDGSQLRLDTATRAKVVFRHGRREVYLPDGQVYFQVEHDPDHPFDVLAGATRVTVLGTRFSVRHTPDIAGNNGVQVAVEEGRVRVGSADQPAPSSLLRAGKDVILVAGQQVSSDTDGRLGPVSAVPNGDVAAWRNSRISFDNTPLALALAEFERYGPTRLLISNPKIAMLRVTGTFNPYRVENFMRVLPEALPVQLAPRGDVTEIAPSGR